MARPKMTTRRKRTTPAKKSTRRKRRVSGVGNVSVGNAVMTVVAATAGAVAARELNNILQKTTPVNTKLVGAGQILAGFVANQYGKSKFIKDMGIGAMAFGGQVLAVEFGVISGVGAVGYGSRKTMNYRISGGGSGTRLSAVNGADSGRYLSAVNGIRKPSMAGLSDVA